MKTVLFAVALMLSLSFRPSTPTVDIIALSKCVDNFPSRAINTLQQLGFSSEIGDTTTDIIMIVMEVVVDNKVNAEAMILGYRPGKEFFIGLILQPQVVDVYNKMFLSASNGSYPYKGRYKTQDNDNIDFYKVGDAYIGFTIDKFKVSRIGIHNATSFVSVYGAK